MAIRRARSVKQATPGSIFLEALESRLLLALPPTWTAVGAGGGGAFFSPSFNPANPSEIFCGTDMSDQYHSTDMGASWSVLNFQQIQGSNTTAVQFTSTLNLLFSLGTNGQPIKSTDGGTTWTNVPGASITGTTLVVDYNNASRFVLETGSSIKLTTNGGTSYTTVASSAAYLSGVFFDGSNIYVGTDTGIYVSSNGGTSFTLKYARGSGKAIPTTEGIVSIAAAKVGTTTRFFAVTATASAVSSSAQGQIAYSYTNIYRLDIGATDWTKLGGIPSGIEPAYAAMARNDINTVYLGGGSTSGTPSVVKSTDAGATWNNVFQTTNNQNIQSGWQCYSGDRGGWGFGEVAEGFTVCPLDSSKVMITDMGGAYLTADGGGTWKAAYCNPADLNPAGQATPDGKAYRCNGLQNTSTWWATWSDANNMFASITDIGGSRSTDGGISWSFNYTGDGYNTMYQAVVSPTTGTMYAAVSSIHDIYQWRLYINDSHIDGGTGEVLYSNDKGATWNRLHNFSKPVVWTALDPNNPNRLYVSVANYGGSGTAGGIYVSNNINLGSASTWTKLANPPRTEGHPFNIVVLPNDGTLVCTYAGRIDPNGNFTASSGVFVSTDGGATWIDRTGTNMNYFCRDITIDPSDPSLSTWWVGVWSMWGSAGTQGGLYKTTDRGQHWTLVPGTAAMDAVTQVAINPTNYNEMYVCTSGDGLWYTSNAQAATPTFTQVANYPFGSPERVFFNPNNPREVWVGSFGNGFRIGFDNSGLLAGDANMDGKVSFADYITLANNFAQTGKWQNGDFNNDYQVTFADYIALANNFGQSTSSVIGQTAGTSSSTLLTALAPATSSLAAEEPSSSPLRVAIKAVKGTQAAGQMLAAASQAAALPPSTNWPAWLARMRQSILRKNHPSVIPDALDVLNTAAEETLL